MRLQFQERPWDLYLLLVYTFVVSGILLSLDVGNVLAILTILFVPGYALTAALFPGSKGIDWIERFILSFGLSIAIVPMVGLLLNYTPYGIVFSSIIASIAVFTGVVGTAAYWRRMRLPVKERLEGHLVIKEPNWAEYSYLDRALVVVLALSVILAMAAGLYVLVAPRPGEPFTEFYLLGPGGNATGFPTHLNVSQPATVFVAVANHEAATVNYTVRVDLVGVQIVLNTTTGFNQTIQLNRTTWSWFNTSLGNRENWTQRYTFSIKAPGTWMVQFLLFRDPDLGTPYHETHILIAVT